MRKKLTDCTMCRHCQSFNYSYGCQKKGKILTTTDLENPGPCFEPITDHTAEFMAMFDRFTGGKQ